MNSKDNIEMKEIKVSRKKTLKEFLDRHIVGFYLVVILAILLFGNIAKAQDAFNPNTVSSVYDILAIFEGDMSSEDYQTILSYVAQYSSCLVLYDPSTHTLMLNATNFPESYACGIDYNTAYRYIIGTHYVTTDISNLSSSNVFKLYVDSDYCYAGITSPTVPISITHPSNTYVYNITTTDIVNHTSIATRPYINVSNTYRYYTPDMPNVLYQSGGNNYYFFQNLNSFAGSFELSMTSYTEDDRLKFWTVNELDGSKTLITVLDGFMQGTEGVMVNEFSNVVLTYELDNVEHTLALNSSNSTIRQSGTATSYKIETPFDAFGVDSQTSIFRITKCDFTQTYSAYGYSTTENYKISCDYLAYKATSPVEPDYIPKETDTNTTLQTPEEKAERHYAVRFNDDEGLDFDEFYDVIFPDNFTLYYVIGSNVSTVNDIASYLPIAYPFAVEINIATDALFQAQIKSYLKNNYLASYFDCIVFEYIFEDATSLTRTYWYYTTTAGRLRTTNTFFADIYTETNQSAHTLGVLYDFLYDRLNDFEDKTLDSLNAQLDIETDSLSWLKTIDNSIKAIDPFDDSSILGVLDNIYDAITGIGGTDTSNIETKLDTLINHFIANNSQENSAYKQFVTWLRDVNGKPVQYVSTGYEFFTELFDYFPFTRDLDGSGGFANMFDMGKGFIDISTGHTTGIPENYQVLSYYFNSANDGTYNVQSMSGR